MYCEECKKRPATVHFTSIVNGVKVENYLCEQCASKKSGFVIELNNKFSIPTLLGSLFGNTYDVQDLNAQSTKVCPNCGMNFESVCQTGRLGCSECYQVFEQELEPILRRIHGNSQHTGKIPARGGERTMTRKKIDAMKAALQKAVANEEYEKAAEIRDSIKSIEKNLE